IAFPLLILSVLYYYYVHLPNQDKVFQPPIPLTSNTSQNEPEVQEPVVEVDPDPEPIQEPEPQAEVNLVKTEGTTDFYAIKNSNQLTVHIEVVGDQCWMAIRKLNKNGEFIEENLIVKRDEVKDWIFDDSVYFNIGK